MKLKASVPASASASVYFLTCIASVHTCSAGRAEQNQALSVGEGQLPQFDHSMQLFGTDPFISGSSIEYYDASPGNQFRQPGSLTGDLAHAPNMLSPRRYPYTYPLNPMGGNGNRYILRDGVHAGLNAPTRIDHGENLEKEHYFIYKMQHDLIAQDLMIKKAKRYAERFDKKIAADETMMKHNKNIYRHFKANVLANQNMLGMAIDAIDPISEAYMKGGGFMGQYDRFSQLSEKNQNKQKTKNKAAAEGAAAEGREAGAAAHHHRTMKIVEY